MPIVAFGHGVRLPFAQWGGFAPATVRCQRVVARAGAECGYETWKLRRACRDAVLAGGTCDEDATTAAIVAARIKALDTVESFCTERQAINLQYLSLSFDLPQDVIDFCRSWETAAESAVYGPVDRGLVTSPADRECVTAAADAADTLTQRIFRSRRQTMDRIAALPLSSPIREQLLAPVATRVAEAEAVVAGRLATECNPPQFTTLYGRTPELFASGLGTRADCVGGRFYIQDRILCPDPVCGNWIVEEPETCDDGNAENGDACPSNCQSDL